MHVSTSRGHVGLGRRSYFLQKGAKCSIDSTMKKCKEKCKKEMFPTVIAEAFIRPLGLCFWDVSKVGFRWRCSHQLRPSWVDSTNTSRMPKRVGGAIGNFCSKRALKKYLGEKAREHEFLFGNERVAWPVHFCCNDFKCWDWLIYHDPCWWVMQYMHLCWVI